MKNQLINSLSDLGLSKIEALTYWELYQRPSITILDLSENLGTYRRRIYENLEKLVELGLVEKLDNFKTKKPNYRAKSPIIIQTLLKSKKYELNKVLNDYEEVLPNLLTKYFAAGSVPSIRIFDGENKFKYLLNIILDEVEIGTDFLAFNEGDDLYLLFDAGYFFNFWVEKRVARKCFAKVLVNGESRFTIPQALLHKQKLREVKSLKNTKIDTSAFWILGNKVIFWDTQSIKAILIENQEIANLMKQIFSITWDNLDS